MKKNTAMMAVDSNKLLAAERAVDRELHFSLRHYAARSISGPSRLLFLLGILSLIWISPLQAGKPTPPLAPSNLTAATVSSSQISLNWRDNSANESGFIIQRSLSASGPWTQVGTAGANVISYTSAGLSAGTTYHYRVCAYNSRGSSAYSSLASATTTTGQSVDTTAPSVPGGLTATAASSSQINLSWGAATDTGGSGLGGYRVYRNGVQIAATGTPSYSNTGLAAGTTYCYTVAAYDNAGNNSAQTPQVCRTTPTAADSTAPSVPAGLTASAVSASQINVSWGASTDTGGSGLGGYRVYRNGVQVATTGTPSYSNTGLAAGTTYCYTVAAYDNAGNNSAQSAQVCRATPTAADTTAPSVPVGLTASAVSASQINLSWGASTDTGGSGLAGYRVYRGGVQVAATATPNFSSTGLAAGSSYCFTVEARDNAGNVSAQSAQACATTPAGSDTVPPTASLTAPGSGASVSGTITLSAAATDNIGVTRVQFFRDGSTLLGEDTTAPYSLAYDTAAIPNGTRSLSCKAYDAAGNSTQSAASTVTVNNTLIAGTWVRAFGGAAGDSGQAVATDGSGNVFLAGYFQGSSAFGGGALASAGGFDIVLAKYSAAGTHVWSKRFGGTGDEFVESIAVDSGGNILIAGRFRGTGDFGAGPQNSLGGLDMFVAKYSSAGDHLWSKRFGDTMDDAANGVAVDATGNVIVTGYFSGAVNFGAGIVYAVYGGPDTIVAKFSPAGAHIWSKVFQNFADDRSTGVAVDTAGNILVAGYFLGTQLDCGGGWLLNRGGSDAYVAKFSSSGTHMWSKSFGGTTVDQATSIAVDANGNVFLLGVFTGSVDFGGLPLTDSGGWDSYIAKFSPTGAHVWSKACKAPGTYDWPNAVAADSSGNVVITGNFRTTLDLGGQVLSAAVAGVQCFYAAKYSTSGSLVWSERFAGTSTEDSAGIATDSSGYVIITGNFQGTGNFGGQSLTSAGSTDVYVLRVDP